jgi:hypothetical protein
MWNPQYQKKIAIKYGILSNRKNLHTSSAATLCQRLSVECESWKLEVYPPSNEHWISSLWVVSTLLLHRVFPIAVCLHPIHLLPFLSNAWFLSISFIFSYYKLHQLSHLLWDPVSVKVLTRTFTLILIETYNNSALCTNSRIGAY